MFITKKIKPEEVPLNKEQSQSAKIQSKSIFTTYSPPRFLADTQNTTSETSVSKNDKISSYIEYLKSLCNTSLSKPEINHITDINIKNINLSDANKGDEIKKNNEDFKVNFNSDYLGIKRKIRFELIKKCNESTLFKTYVFSKAKTRLNKFRTNKDKLNSSNINISSGINEGKWSFDEHIKFIEGIILFKNNWVKVAKYLGNRTSIQARSHSQKFYLKLKRIKNNKFNINFQDRNIKSIFDIINLLKGKNNSNNIEKEYIINALIYLSKIINLRLLNNTNKNKIDDKYNNDINDTNDIINVNETKNINNNTNAIQDSGKTKKNIKKFTINKINDKLSNNNNENNDKEKDDKIRIDNTVKFKNSINIDINSNINLNKMEKEDKLNYEYINTLENQSYIFDDDIFYLEDVFDLSDIINLN